MGAFNGEGEDMTDVDKARTELQALGLLLREIGSTASRPKEGGEDAIDAGRRIERISLRCEDAKVRLAHALDHLNGGE